MKKLLVVAFGLFLLTSCVKDWTCECSDGYTVTYHTTKKAAKDFCALDGSDCSLK